MHPFVRIARKRLEMNAQVAANAIGCDIAHVLSMAADHLQVVADNIEKGRADDGADLQAAREAVPQTFR